MKKFVNHIWEEWITSYTLCLPRNHRKGNVSKKL